MRFQLIGEFDTIKSNGHKLIIFRGVKIDMQ